MGGAERNARKRRQARQTPGPKPAVARHNPNSRRNVVIGVVVVVVLLGAVLGGVIYTTNNDKKNATEGQSIQPKAPATSSQLDDAASGAATNQVSVPVRRDDAAVVVGKPDAKATVDLYEDFLCPVCHEFEQQYGADLTKHVEAGTLRLRYHMLPLLNDHSDPPGYSLDAANAGLCAADAGKFPAFHLSLYNAQPEEGARGWDKGQLTKLGKDLGITSPDFAPCVADGKYDKLIQDNFTKIESTDYLQQDFNGQRGFGTPTIALGHKVIDWSNPKWLDNVVNEAS